MWLFPHLQVTVCIFISFPILCGLYMVYAFCIHTVAVCVGATVGQLQNFFALPSKSTGNICHMVEIVLYEYSHIGRAAISSFCDFNVNKN